MASLLREPALAEGLPVLIDSRGAETSIRLTEVSILVARTLDLTHRGLSEIAIVTDPSPLHILASAFQVAGAAVGVYAAVFTDMKSARGWLDLDAQRPLASEAAKGKP